MNSRGYQVTVRTKTALSWFIRFMNSQEIEWNQDSSGEGKDADGVYYEYNFFTKVELDAKLKKEIAELPYVIHSYLEEE
jgi:hypothetical protein